MKANVLHVQPPAEVLSTWFWCGSISTTAMRRMGALRVIPGSHLHGRVPEEDIPAIA